ncbi:MAG: hypothetical protein MJE77_40990 [Proteobacteria bacterium]|nr:hypothetical protein [Pseudomonadota bacterium]
MSDSRREANEGSERSEPSSTPDCPVRPSQANASRGVIQRRVAAGTFKEFLEDQGKLQNEVKKDPATTPYQYTTVGFEHEFAQMTDGPLRGIDHLEVARSFERMPLTELPFVLETDASDALELVSPPFLMETPSSGRLTPKSWRKPIPLAADVKKVDDLIRTDLSKVSQENTIVDLVGALLQESGITFPLAAVEVEPFQISPAGRTAYGQANKDINAGTVAGIPIRPSQKGGGITTQINFATDAATADRLQEESRKDPNLVPDSDIGRAILAVEDGIRALLLAAAGRRPSTRLKIFLNALSRTLSGQTAVPYMRFFHDRQVQAFAASETMEGPEPDLFDVNRPSYFTRIFALTLTESVSSRVKDTSGIWVKDAVLNIGLGVLTRAEWITVRDIVTDHQTAGSIENLTATDVSKHMPADFRDPIVQAIRQATRAALVRVQTVIDNQILHGTDDNTSKADFAHHTKDLDLGPGRNRGEFAEHNPDFIGPRQDTYIASADAQRPGIWENKRLHVVETRAEFDKALELLRRVGG